MPNSGTLANKQAAPDVHLIDPRAKETTRVRAAALTRETTRSNRVHDRVAMRFRPANAMVSSTGQIPSQASMAAHRAERLAGRFVEPETRPTTIEGWMVRDVISGKAILDGPDGIRNVARGEVLPGLGKVDSIVRWGNRWIVSTEQGLIATP